MRTALVLGGASSVWQDSASALALFTADAVIAANDIGARWAGPLSAWCTLHPDKMQTWRDERARRGFSQAGEHVGHEMAPGIERATDYRFPGMTGSGSSGLFAVKIALEQGFDRAVLAGVPMTPEGAHFFDAAVWAERDGFAPAWLIALPIIKDRVRSMSGWTMELLGQPDQLWLSDSGFANLAAGSHVDAGS